MRHNNVHQDSKWVTATGEILLLEEMTPRHRSDVLAFLRRRARSLKFWDDVALTRGLLPRGDAATDAFEDACARQLDTTASCWLEDTALVRRLRVLTGEESPNAHVPTDF